jgi:DNA processing protein
MPEGAIQALGPEDDDYPANLRGLAHRPRLFVWGQLCPQDERAVAIVGTRQPSGEGLRRATRLATALAREGVTIVSGLARGIDTAAHLATLRAGGRTLAVVGTGLSHCYPPENRALHRQISHCGAVISQFPADFRGARSSFPQRNRVIAGLSRVSVVIEAASGSGAQNEAQAASKIGRPVFLLNSLVQSQAWAREMVEKKGARILNCERQVLEMLD